MSGPKSDAEVMVEVAMQGMLPLMAKRLRGSPKYEALIEKMARTRAFIKDAQENIDQKMAEMEQDAKDFLTDFGLGQVLADIDAASQRMDVAESDPAATPMRLVRPSEPGSPGAE